MLKKIGFSLSVVSLVLILTSSDVFAQARIHFRRGSNSASVSGNIAANAVRSYVLRARRGQTLTATLSSGNGRVDFTQGNLHDSQFSRMLERNGDIYIDIDNHGNRATRFTLTVSIQ